MASTARLDELKKKFDENPRRYFAPLANEHRKSGDLDQAIALCRAHLPQQPAHISGHIVLAQALFEAGSLDEAREIFHTALGLDPENLIALRYLGDIARESSDIGTARQWYQRVLEVDPRNDEIEQLVRDLDAPPPDTAGDPTVPEAEAASEGPPVAAPKPAMVAPVDNDARFAPLSIEQMDLDAIDAPSSSERAGATADQGALDAHAALNSDAPTVELPALDVDEIDPFDLNPAASAEALYDPHSAPPADDFFLTELAEPTASATPIDEAQFAEADTWFPPAPAQPAAAEAPVEAASASFEEGDFYIEPAPAAPSDAVSSTQSVDASNDSDSAWELPNAPEPPDARTASANQAAGDVDASFDAVDDVSDVVETVAETRSADAIAELAESPTAEWHAPQPPAAPAQPVSAANDLGLEVMEFVPPTADSMSSPASADADSIGHAPDLSDQGTTPSSFVTETMAELYLQQGFRNEALAVYRELLARNPADANLRERVEQIENGSMSSIGMATLSEGVVESARKRQTAKPTRSVRSFFASLAGRRAPVPESRDVDADASNEQTYTQPEEVPIEAVSAESVESAMPAQEPQAWQDSGHDSGQINPIMSAAETLATFDPFADAGDMSSERSPAVPESAPPDPILFAPNADPAPVAPGADPLVVPSAESESTSEPPARRTLDDLFPDTPITPRTESAAQTLATAFGRPEPAGRPTRAASSELSLDNVFRGAPEGAPPAEGGFSFDQFFSDARPAGTDATTAAMSPPETGRSGGGAGDAHDIEQFTAWLEGLKKK